jgi:hypothetical protein
MSLLAFNKPVEILWDDLEVHQYQHFDHQKRMVRFNPNWLLPCRCGGWQVVNGKMMLKEPMVSSSECHFCCLRSKL